ncbi:GNAT family N-acetyltransferase [Nocardioides sp. P5_C9_2]
MSRDAAGRMRQAGAEDAPALLSLWEGMVEEMGFDGDEAVAWRGHALAFVTRSAADPDGVRLPVVEVDGELVASAVGTLETGVPNPHSPTGRGVRLANVFTLPTHRGRGHATGLIEDVIAWAQRIGADRIDLSATPEGLRTYERLGFTLASAPRMKRML